MQRQKINIIICTYNRAAILVGSLESFFRMTLPSKNEFELLIVDNNSTDETRHVVDQFIEQHQEVRYVFEPQPGLSHARNTGIIESHGNIIAFVDDDIFFDPAWLIEVMHFFRDHPEVSCMGGKSIPQFSGGRPDWITDDLLTLYGSTNSGDEVKKMVYPEHPFGLNMAFRRKVFDRIGNFGTHLGRKKKNLLSNEESDLFLRIHNAGLIVMYTPNALLYHRIPADRVRKNWIISRYYWQGISDIAFHQAIEQTSKVQLLRSAFHDARKLATSITGGYRSPRKVYWHFNAIHFRERIRQAYLWGRIRQMLKETLSFS